LRVALVTAPLLGVTPVTPRSRLLQLDLHDAAFAFRPGHAVLIGRHGQPLRRPYSIACSPERAAETGVLELLIALEADGSLGPHLTSPEQGTLIDVDGPLGTFTFPEDAPQDWLLFVAGGTGISPLRSMIDHVLRQQPGRHVSVLYSARRGDEFAFIEEFREHATGGRLELHQTVTRDESESWSGRRGRIGRAEFESVLHAPAETLCFVCGPRELVDESVATLRTLGVASDAIRTEGWKVPGV
jgi:NAD(P)H-flavin reductase